MSLVNAAFKHLEDKPKIGGMTIAQWGSVLAGVVLAVVWSLWVSPFAQAITFFAAIYIASIPVLAAFIAEVTEFDPLDFARNLWRWRREPGRFLPGPGDDTRGYELTRDPRERRRYSGRDAPDLEELWR